MSNVYEEFYTTFEIPKVECMTPGRDWDDDGLASWYVDKQYPDITEETLVQLILLNNSQANSIDKPLDGKTYYELVQQVLFQTLLLYPLSEDKEAFKEQVKDIFEFGEV